ncbi:MAG: hypothetical protein O2856_05740 [Planctomycetota bacterium]|nr:hypothetical protein [Planctomycetota bacterium]
MNTEINRFMIFQVSLMRGRVAACCLSADFLRLAGRAATLATMIFLCLCRPLSAAELVQIVYGVDAPSIERYAASELGEQFERLFENIEADVVAAPQPHSGTVVFVGSPATNPHVARLFVNWPAVSDQGIVIQSIADQRIYAVGGGSPSATLWAAYELGHRLGIRYLPRGDIYPREKRPFSLVGIDTVMEPQLRSRTWRTINDFAIGPESWGIDEQRSHLRQLAKLKFNRVMLSVYPWQPFVSYEFGGVTKSTATHWYDEKFPVDGDTVGKKVFHGKHLFENPDFSGLATSDELHKAGQRYMQAIIDTAHELGMTVGVSIVACEFPLEFQKTLPGSRIAHQYKNLTITPADEQGPTDSILRKLVATQIRAYLDTYPTLDRLYVSLPEWPDWAQHAEQALKLLKERGLSSDLTVDGLVQLAADRKTIVSGERGRQAISGNLVGLAFFQVLFDDPTLLKRADGKSVELVITSIDPALFPVLDQVVPRGAGTLNFVDYTSRRSVENMELIAQVPAEKVHGELIMTLADDNVGILPQSAMKSLSTLTATIKEHGWSGFSTRYWVPGELDSAMYFLARSSWAKDLTAELAVRELWTTATGNAAAADRLWKAWDDLERATDLIDRHEIGFTFPVPGMLMKHYTPAPIPDWWQQANDAYTDYLTELYRVQGAIDGDAVPILFYYAKRSEFALEYLAAVKAVKEAAIAKAAGDSEKTLEHLETALEQTHNCINTLADVAQDQSDRGVIAILNAYAMRPLQAEYDALMDAE